MERGKVTGPGVSGGIVGVAVVPVVVGLGDGVSTTSSPAMVPPPTPATTTGRSAAIAFISTCASALRGRSPPTPFTVVDPVGYCAKTMLERETSFRAAAIDTMVSTWLSELLSLMFCVAAEASLYR